MGGLGLVVGLDLGSGQTPGPCWTGQFLQAQVPAFLTLPCDCGLATPVQTRQGTPGQGSGRSTPPPWPLPLSVPSLFPSAC